MSVSNEFIAYIQDLLSPLGEITAGRMFGGALLKYKGKQLGVIMDDTLYFRTPKELREKYKAHGSAPFQYEKKGKTVIVEAWWSVPERLLDSPDELTQWAEEALFRD